jgi:presenilin-like A22 family membrane protease
MRLSGTKRKLIMKKIWIFKISSHCLFNNRKGIQWVTNLCWLLMITWPIIYVYKRAFTGDMQLYTFLFCSSYYDVYTIYLLISLVECLSKKTHWFVNVELALNATSSPLWQIGIALGNLLNQLLPSPILLASCETYLESAKPNATREQT